MSLHFMALRIDVTERLDDGMEDRKADMGIV